MHIEQWLEAVPALAVYLLVVCFVGVESVGVPVPGETVLIGAALIASQHDGVDPVVVAGCAAAGAAVGDSVGYAIGHRYGRGLFARAERRFPKHFGPQRIAVAERAMTRYGMRAVFFGRFVAWLRIFAGPLAGVLRMRYWRFALANVTGAAVWAAAITTAVFYLGRGAEEWVKRFSWAGLAVLAVVALAGWLVWRRRRAAHAPGGD